MEIYNQINDKLKELEKEMSKKWYMEGTDLSFYKFEKFIFNIDGKLSVRFHKYNFYLGMDSVVSVTSYGESMFKYHEVEEEYVNDHISHVAQLKLLGKGE